MKLIFEIDTEKEKNCRCSCWDYNYDNICGLSPFDDTQYCDGILTNRPKWCPLVEVQQKREISEKLEIFERINDVLHF